jgi:hypothetical protein
MVELKEPSLAAAQVQPAVFLQMFALALLAGAAEPGQAAQACV